MLKKTKIIAGIFLFVLVFFGGKTRVEAATRIHYLGLNGATDAILLESDGRFGMIDSGEDWDYPKGNDAKYPWRNGVDKSNGHEQQVIYYMQKAGVTKDNFDFYLGTHAHSDHIGTGDEVLSVFTPKKVYLKQYNDANINNQARWWDNKYVYDVLLKAAKKNSTVVQQIKEGTTIKLGKNMKITLYNTGVRKNVSDENWNSIVAKVTAYKTTTVLGADAVPNVMHNLANKGKFGRIDILKLPHHGYLDGNPADLMNRLAPKQAIVTGFMSNLNAQTRNALIARGTNIQSNNGGIAALVTDYSTLGYSTSSKNVKAGWLNYNNGRYYIQKNGRPATGWKEISGQWYYFTNQGKARTGWVTYKDKIYYLSKSKAAKGKMLRGWQTIDGQTHYFAKKNGDMLTGWVNIGSKKYYFNKTGNYGIKGRLLTGWQKIGKQTFYFKTVGNAGTKGRMLTGWNNIKNQSFYFKKVGGDGTKGQLLTDWRVISGKEYFFKKSGNLGDMGRALTGFNVIGKDIYYFDTSNTLGKKGQMRTGWITVDDRMYYLSKNGILTDVFKQSVYEDGKASSFISLYNYASGEADERGIRGVVLKLGTELPKAGGIAYQIYTEEKGWSKASKNGALSSQEGLIKAVKIKLEKSLANEMDIYYRVYLAGYGWLGWAKNAEIAGTIIEDFQVSGLQIQLRPKNKPITNTEEPCLGPQRKMITPTPTPTATPEAEPTVAPTVEPEESVEPEVVTPEPTPWMSPIPEESVTPVPTLVPSLLPEEHREAVLQLE